MSAQYCTPLQGIEPWYTHLDDVNFLIPLEMW